MKIPFSKVDCSGNELSYIQEVLESGWLTTASKAIEFEDRFRSMIGSKYAFAVNSCTSALHLALEAAGVGAGDKVLVPSMTFTASAEVIRYLGADPLLLDVEYGTAQLTVEIIKNALIANSGVKALIVVDFGGQPAQLLSDGDSDGIIDLCHRHNVKVIEDAAHAFPAKLMGKFVGNISDITCFSFYANKTITTGEGGMLTTNDDEIAKRVRLMRLHGIDRDIWNRFNGKNKSSWEYDVKAPGYKYNMPDINAAVGLAQLERAEEMRNERERIAIFYLHELRNIDGLDLPINKIPPSDHAWHLFPVVLNKYARIDRDSMIEKLTQDGIGISVHYKPLHRMSYYRENYNLAFEDYPVTEKIWKGCLSLPIYPSLDIDDMRFIVSRIQHHLG